MNERKFGRREVMTGAAAAGAVALLSGLGSATVAQASDGSDGPAGAYLIRIHSAITDETNGGVVGFADGGVAVGSDSSSPTSRYQGAWQRTGANAFKARFLEWQFDGKGANVGYAFIDAHGTTKGNSVSGTYTVRAFSEGGPSQEVDHGTFAGETLAP
jgi:hypothetical protein